MRDVERARLVKLAEAAQDSGKGWYSKTSLRSQIQYMPSEDFAFIAAASPEVVLALVAEIEGLEDAGRPGGGKRPHRQPDAGEAS